ncbi:MAG: glycosyltransferase [Cyclobacteriaceae bacterium]
MISVCMAVKDGGLFIEEQIQSILPQLGVNDELIVSDDHSFDATINIVNSFADKRVKIITNPGDGIVDNFENAIKHSCGDKIFLADQDDVWVKDKIEKMSMHLDRFNVVICDCIIVDRHLNPEPNSFFEVNKSSKGLIKNIIRNSYMGCCMAFNRTVLNKILPFPRDIAMHDLWIGLVAEIHYSVYFLPEQLVLYRRHSANASSSPSKSSRSIKTKVTTRLHLVKNLLRLAYA